MAVNTEDNTATVITAFICTIIVVTLATMFSCFRKKKGDKKKKKDDKKNAPVPAPVHTPGVQVDIKPAENHSNDDAAINDAKSSKVEAKNFQETTEALGDFSAVRETEILRSYRKPPPPQNRARQSRAPRALKSSAENLDIFSELNNDQLFEDSTIKATVELDAEDKQEKDVGKEKDEVNDDDERAKKRGSSQGRSSMLDDINNTLASIQSEASEGSTSISEAVKEKAEEVREEITSRIAATVNTQVEEKIEDVKETVVDKDSSDMKSDLKDELENRIAAPLTTLVKEKADDVLGMKKSAKEEVENVEKVEKDLDEKMEKVVDAKDELTNQLQDAGESVKEEAGQVDIKDIACELKDKIEEKVKDSLLSLKVDEDSTPSESDKQVLADSLEVEVPAEKSQTESNIEVLKKEVKIPPKVSPKPSPKFKPKNDFSETVAQEQSTNQESEFSPAKFIEEKIDAVKSFVVESQDKTATEKVDSPPVTPTTPTSPISPSAKGQSRIPMSKKASGIPKLSFSSSKAPSASPLSSPDAAGKKFEQAKEVLQKVEQEGDKFVASADLNTSNGIPSSPTPAQVEAELTSSKEMSPINDDGQGSRRKLTKLRYSGRKKSSESKSDESGSDRGSRAGSEAKSEDGKKAVEEIDVEKNSRIPVRGGSKPRSSPPKAVGNQ